MGAAQVVLDRLVERLAAVAPVRVHPAQESAPVAVGDEVQLVPLSLARTGRSHRAGSLLDLELRVLVQAAGPRALDHIEQVILTLEPLPGYVVESNTATVPPAADPIVPLRLVVSMPVTLTLPEPTVPIVTQPPVVDVRPGYVPATQAPEPPDARPRE